MHNQWFVIVNPCSGSGKGAKDWPRIASLLGESGIPFEAVFTQRPNHATELAGQAVRKGWRRLIAVGGDGTLNEVVNGIFGQKTAATQEITLGMIPVGTGNDWGRTVGIPSDYAEAVNAIESGGTMLQDIGYIRYRDFTTRKTLGRYFINIAGMGYDATVVAKTNTLKERGRGNKFSYLISLFSCLMKYKKTAATIRVDQSEIKARLFSMNVGICKYSGGGMMQVPGAVPDDGLFDLTIVKDIGKLKVIANVAKLYDGSFIRLPEVETIRGKRVRIESEPAVPLEVDGELLGESPFEAEIIPRSLRIITRLEAESQEAGVDGLNPIERIGVENTLK